MGLCPALASRWNTLSLTRCFCGRLEADSVTQRVRDNVLHPGPDYIQDMDFGKYRFD